MTDLEPIPILDLSEDIDTHLPAYMAAIERVMRSGHFILGPNVKALEEELATYLGSAHAVACNSGTDALTIALRALGVGPGDEVITTAFTFMATASAIGQVGATPVFVDIDPETLNIDTDAVAAAISPRTRALIPVHLFGHAAELSPLLKLARTHGFAVLEDVAQGFGASYERKKLGTWGDVGAFSFFPTKNLGAFGDGGVMVTDSLEVADRLRMLRAHGSRKKYHNEVIGYNSRLDELQAAILRLKLERIEEANAGRRRVAALYGERLGDMPLRLPTERPGCHHVFHQFTVVLDEHVNRDAVREALAAEKISTMVYYPVPLHKLPVFEHLQLTLPTCEALAERVLSLPIWPELSEEKIDRVSSALRRALVQQT